MPEINLDALLERYVVAAERMAGATEVNAVHNARIADLMEQQLKISEAALRSAEADTLREQRAEATREDAQARAIAAYMRGMVND